MGLSSTCGWYYKGLCQPYQRERQSETWELNLFFTGQLAPLSLFLCLIFSCGCWDPVLGKKKEKKKHLIITRGCSYYKKELQLHTVRFCTFIAPFIRLRCNKAAGRTSAGFKWHKSAFLREMHQPGKQSKAFYVELGTGNITSPWLVNVSGDGFFSARLILYYASARYILCYIDADIQKVSLPSVFS